MKRKIIILLMLIPLILTGCKNSKNNEVVEQLIKKIKNLNSYQLSGKLEILNNDDVYNYQVLVDYKKENYYKVDLKNLSNNHQQVILKNDEGVFVVTPSLNKSYKFESNWPNNNSQIYLIDIIIEDLEKDSNYEVIKENSNYIIKSNVNYPNNKSLKKQKLLVDENLNIKKVEILNEDEIPLMTLNIEYIDYKKSFSESNFELNTIINTSENTDAKTSQTIKEAIYPLYIPTGTVLKDEEKVMKTDGERIILTFSGEKPFTLIEETVVKENEFTVIPTYGEPFMLIDTVGSLSQNSINWTSNGLEYYIVSDVLSQNELIDIAKSVSNIYSLK